MAIENARTCPEQFRRDGFHPVMFERAQTYEIGITDQVVFLEHYAAYAVSGVASLASGDSVSPSNFLGVAVSPAGSASAGVNSSGDAKVRLVRPGACLWLGFWAKVADGALATADGGTVKQFNGAGLSIHGDTTATNFGFKILLIDVSNGYAFGHFSAV